GEEVGARALDARAQVDVVGAGGGPGEALLGPRVAPGVAVLDPALVQLHGREHAPILPARTPRGQDRSQRRHAVTPRAAASPSGRRWRACARTPGRAPPRSPARAAGARPARR